MADRDDKSKNNALDRATEALRNAPVHEGPPPQLVASTIKTLQASTKTPANIRLHKRRQLMLRLARYGGLTVAALAVAVIASVWFFDSGSAFADVLKAVQAARSVSFTVASQLGQGPPFAMRWHHQGHVVRGETPGVMLIRVDLETREVVQLDLRSKRAFQWTMEDSEMRTFRREARDPIDIFTTLKAPDARKIGRDQIDTQETVVYQVKRTEFSGVRFNEDENPRLTVWVNPRTKLPVQIALRCSTEQGQKSRDVFLWTDFRWNEPPHATRQKLQIPEEQTTIEGPPPKGPFWPDLEKLIGVRRPPGS